MEAFRLSRNLRQVDLAKSAGISRSTLARFESGAGASLDTLIRILRALDLDHRLDLLVPDASKNPLTQRDRQRARPRWKEKQTSDTATYADESAETDGYGWSKGGSSDQGQSVKHYGFDEDWSKRDSGFFSSSDTDSY